MEAVQRGACGDTVDSELGEESGEAVPVEATDDLVPEFVYGFIGVLRNEKKVGAWFNLSGCEPR